MLSPTRGAQHVPLRQMPPHLINAVVAVEDERFFKHKGIDYIAIVRAALADLYARRLVQGGSTITQQLAKITFLSPEKTLKRKLREAALAIKIERSLSKEEILELYLNRVYLGHGAYGVGAAARLYFDKPVSALTLPEAALLAGLIRAPARYSPFNNAHRAKRRQLVVLRRMQEAGFLTPRQAKEAAQQVIELSAKRPRDESINYFIDYVRRQLEAQFGPQRLYYGGLRVYTTLDVRLQALAEQALQEGLRALEKRRGWRGPIRRMKLQELPQEMPFVRKFAPGDILEAVVLEASAQEARLWVEGREGILHWRDALWARRLYSPRSEEPRVLEPFSLQRLLEPGDVVLVRIKEVPRQGPLALALEQEPQVQGALLALEPRTGYLRAMVGGYQYGKSEYNRAVYALRQPGSAFKPVIYAAALEAGYTPASIIVDEETTYEWSPEDIWSPKNYDEKHYGPTRLREALAYSRNVVTVKLLDEMGIGRAISFARKLGIQAKMPRDLTLALGSLSLTPMELIYAYSPFANGGFRVKPQAIKYIADSRGRIVLSYQPQNKRVMSPETAFLATSMMQDVVNYGTGWRAKAVGKPVAAKTGTTDEYRDAWFIGYSKNLLCGVWVGFDDMSPLGKEETGSRAAGPIWVAFMKEALRGQPPEWFEPPEGIVSYWVDTTTGLRVKEPAGRPLATYYREYFRRGTEPPLQEPLPLWQVAPETLDYD